MNWTTNTTSYDITSIIYWFISNIDNVSYDFKNINFDNITTT